MASSTHSDDTLHVAIAGAGIAGLAAAVALTRNFGSRVDVQLYDKASALREIGASIALGPNGLRTLEKLGVENALDDDVAFRGPSGLPMIYRYAFLSACICLIGLPSWTLFSFLHPCIVETLRHEL